MKKVIVFLVVCLSVGMLRANHWTPIDEGQYAYSMTLYGVIQIDGVEQFNQYMRSFANNAEKGLAIVKGTNGNGIVPIARNIVSQDNDAGKKMRDYLNAKNCKQICTMFNEGTDKNREYSDLYAYYSTSWAILKRSKEVFTKQEGQEDTKAREGINRESNDIQKDSYQFPCVSPDSLINEIYKYIRGSK